MQVLAIMQSLKSKCFCENAVTHYGVLLFKRIDLLCRPLLNFTLLHRYYSKDYQAIQGNAYRQATNIGNENGLVIGTQVF